jgi:hypothetical protein
LSSFPPEVFGVLASQCLKLLKNGAAHDGAFFMIIPKLLNTFSPTDTVYLGIPSLTLVLFFSFPDSFLFRQGPFSKVGPELLGALDRESLLIRLVAVVYTRASRVPP